MKTNYFSKINYNSISKHDTSLLCPWGVDEIDE
jgi:hypothetical protein